MNNTNTGKDVLRRQEWVLCSAGNIYTLPRSSVWQHASDSKRATETLDSGVVWNLFICSNTDAYVRFLRVFWMTHLKCSVVFDWNRRNAPSMKRVHDRILTHRWGFKVFLMTHIKFSGVSVKWGPDGGGWRMADGGWRMADGGWRIEKCGW